MSLPKILFRKKAVELRNRGFSYSEILKEVPVAKSSLSLWLRPVSLNGRSKERLRLKLLEAQKLGALAKREQRKQRTKEIQEAAISEIGEIDNKALLLIGTMLYWAEGTKQSKSNISQQVAFTNSDPVMCRLFMRWAIECLGVSSDRFVPSIYIHESRQVRARLP